MAARPVAVVARRGARRLVAGHPWVFRSDVAEFPDAPAGLVTLRAVDGAALGTALWSPTSEIALRRLEADPARVVDAAWWHARLADCVRRRAATAAHSSAYRLVHGEGDLLPSLVVDRYDRWLVVQLLSAGLETQRAVIVDALQALTGCAGILARHDVASREREALPRTVELLAGDVPRTVEVHEHGVRFLAAPWDGQKTGAFLDQRENRALVGRVARGEALDCFAYHGSFALHCARGARRVVALDVSSAALARATENATLNGFANVEPLVGDAFDVLRDFGREGRRFDTIVVDPPAFAKTRRALPGALRGYKDVNLHAMRLLAPGGTLFTASCSFHLDKATFLAMLQEAAADSGRRLQLRAFTVQPDDHPELLGVPETGYLKGALLEALD